MPDTRLLFPASPWPLTLACVGQSVTAVKDRSVNLLIRRLQLSATVTPDARLRPNSRHEDLQHSWKTLERRVQ